MPEQLVWRPLPLAGSHGMPVLLAAVQMWPTSYSLRVTDMVNLWVENLDRKAIVKRGWAEETSIDPSETPENMAKFLGSLRSALDSSQPGHDQTSLTLSQDSIKVAGEDGLIVKVRCPLPGILPLVWPFHLQKAPPSALVTDLVLPLMEGQHDRKRQVDSLIQALGHKDAVIARLADKLEAMGAGLENVFTGLSGRKKVTRAHAGEKIRGLAPFDPSRWESGQDQVGTAPTDIHGLLQDMSAAEGLRTKLLLDVEASPDLDTKWWHSLSGAPSLPALSHREMSSPSTRLQKETPSLLHGNGDDNINSCGNGSGGPRSPTRSGGSGRDRAPPTLGDDESTADEDDGVATTVTLSQRSRDSHTAQPARSGPLGKIGGPRPAQSARVSEPRAASPRRKRAPAVDDDEETASDTDTASVQGNEHVESSAPAQAPSPTPFSSALPNSGRASPRKGGIGRIGGVPKTPQSSGAERADDSTKGIPPQRRIGTIGRIGGVAGTSSQGAAAAADGVERGRELNPKEQDSHVANETPKPRETSTERSHRRQEELKREMEKMSAAPLKKKRRF